MVGNVDFVEFIWIWNKLQNQNTPRHQRKMARWLTSVWKGENRQALLMAFRNSGKSTIVGLFCAWLFMNNPNLRIMVLAADNSLAKKMVRNVKRIIEKHPLVKHLCPSTREQWASGQFTINRTAELRDPSMLAKGLGANITGSRADIIICDDVEVPKTCDTANKREDLRSKLNELDYVLVPDGVMLYAGTPHTFYTIYRNSKKNLPIDCDAFLLGFEKLEIPIIDNKGESQWKERFSKDRINAIRARTGENKFSSQMLLKPVNIAEGRLNPDKMRLYDSDIDYVEANGETTLKINGKKMLSASCWWDPSFGLNGGDSSVIACVFTGDNGDYWLHDIEYINVDDDKKEKSAQIQCEKVCKFLSRNKLPSVRIEKNGLGKFLPELLRQQINKSNISCSVLEVANSKNKEMRILEAFDAILANMSLHINKKVAESRFVAEMREWVADGKCKDDGLDAVAGCLLSEPVRLPKFGVVNKKHDWRFNKNHFVAGSDFTLY